jgi:hypothetical protein
MSMGSREDGKQPPLWVTTSELARGEGHIFYRRLNELLARHGFDGFGEGLVEEKKIFAETLGRPSIPPGTYTRMMFVGDRGSVGEDRGQPCIHVLLHEGDIQGHLNARRPVVSVDAGDGL